MLVNPGYIGQPMVEGTMEKVCELKNLNYELMIEVDDNVTFEHARILKEYGATHYVCGSSSIFGDGVDQLEENIQKFRKQI